MKKYFLISPLILSTLAIPAAAQERPSQRPTMAGWSVNLGAGALLSPNYLGDDAYSLSVVPYIRVTHGERFFADVQGGAGYNVIKQENFRLGPLLQLEFGRDEDGSGTFRVAGERTDDLRGFGDIDTSVSLGGFAEVDFGKVTASAKLGQALSGHDGFTGEIGLGYKGVLRGNGPPIIYSLGPRINFGDNKYMTALFGVNNVQSQAANLPAFEASGGIVSYGLSGTAIMPVTDTLSATFIGSYKRLTSDAGNSPLVTQRGSRDQAFVGFVASQKIR